MAAQRAMAAKAKKDKEKKEIKEEDPGKADMVASAIQKALNKHKGDESKTYQLQQARKAMNKGDLDKAEKIAKRLAEKLKSN
jgi:outer membrane PBP1 activator LpoA protein